MKAKRSNRYSVAFYCLSAICLLALALAGCAAEPAPEPEADTAAAPKLEVRTYTVEGKIVELPPTSEAGAEIRIHHQAIPNFLAAHGKEMEMGEMTMPFHLGEGLSLDALEVGDAVRFQFEVDWSRDPSDAVVSIEKLAVEMDEAEVEMGGEDHAGHEM
jgi:Cu/Ag efflux protein CusF